MTRFRFEKTRLFCSYSARERLCRDWVVHNRSDPTISITSLRNYSYLLDSPCYSLSKLETCDQYRQLVERSTAEEKMQNEPTRECNSARLEACHPVKLNLEILGIQLSHIISQGIAGALRSGSKGCQS